MSDIYKFPMDDLVKTSSNRLIEAVKIGDEETVRGLLQHDRINALARDNDVPRNGVLYYAVVGNHPSILELLLQHGACPNEICYTHGSVIDMAILTNKFEFAELLLRYGARINFKLYFVCGTNSGANRQCTLLFYHYTDLRDRDDNGMTILHLSIVYEDLEGLSILIGRRANVNERSYNEGLTPLLIAAKMLSGPCISALLVHGAVIDLKDEYGYGPLHRVITSETPDSLDKQLEAMQLLLRAGCDVNLKSNSNVTALHLACSTNAHECLKLLLRNGADPNIRDDYGRTPLFRLADETSGRSEERQAKALQLLISAGADVNVPNNQGVTPLHILAGRTREVSVTLLLRVGAQPNAQDEQGHTPLHTLARLPVDYTDKVKQVRIAQILLDAGADVNVVSRDQKTPFLSALEVRAGGVVRLIIKHINLMRYSKRQRPHKIDREVIIAHPRWGKYYILCHNELELMHETMLTDKLSVGNFLTRRTSQLMFAVNWDTYTTEFRDRRFRKSFKIYWGMLRRRYYQALERKILRQNASLSLSLAMGVVDSNNLLVEHILGFLGIHDMKSLITAAGLDEQRKEKV